MCHKLEGTLAADQHPVRRTAYGVLPTFRTLVQRNWSLHTALRKVRMTRPLPVRWRHDTSLLCTLASLRAVNTSEAGRRTCGVKKVVRGWLSKAFSSLTTVSQAAVLPAFIAITHSLSTCSMHEYTRESLPYKKYSREGLPKKGHNS